jgi:hypothetical protein
VNPSASRVTLDVPEAAGARLVLGEGAGLAGSVLTLDAFGFGVWESADRA